MLKLSRPTALTLVFFSGATGLIYEFCWSKRLANWLGNTGQAHAILLATFMGGLALGAWLFGRRADATKHPLRLYGMLELAVGVLALLFPTVLDAMGKLYLLIGAAAGTPARMFLAVVTVLPPALLMGGSLPAMTRALTVGLGTAKSTLASLYGLNSLGAAVGSLLAGMFFVPVAGLATTERFAVLFNILVGLLGIAASGELSSKAPGSDPSKADDGEDSERLFDSSAVKAVLIGTALSGFTAMLYEVTWIRLLSIIIGGTSYAFTLILSAFIFGIALGSFWISRRRGVNALTAFGWLQFLLVVVVVLTIPLYRRLPFLFFHLTQLLRPDTAWNVYLFLTFCFCGLLLIPPTFLMGASFPLGARVVMRSKETVGGEVGRVYLYNTLGTIVGSLAGGLVLLPLIGLEGNFTVGLVANLVAAFLTLRAAADQRVKALLAAAVVLIGVSATATHGWSRFISEAGRYREWHGHFSDFEGFEKEATSRGSTLFYADDVFASVMVAQQGEKHRFLRINGKADGSNDIGDLDTQALAAHLGMLTHPGPVKRVLLVGIGAGITAGSVLTHDLERLDVVEISPAVVDAAGYFSADNRNALKDPRCHVFIEDARTFLALSPEKYDLIISVPSNPWVTGVSGLFSRDFFRIARERLAPGGRVVQWIHTYESNEALVKLVVRTLRDSFEHGTTWLGAADMLLIASREPQVFDADEMTARMQPPAVAEDLRRMKVTRVSSLLGRQVHSDEGQLEFAGEGPINTDDHNLLEYLSPIAYFRAGAAYSLYDERLAGAEAGARLFFPTWQKTHPLDEGAWAELYATLTGVHDAHERLVRSVAHAWFAAAPQSLEALLAVTKCELLDGEFSLALTTLEPFAMQAEPDVRVLSLYLRAVVAAAANGASVFSISPDRDALRAHAQRVVSAHPEAAELKTVLETL